MPLDSSDMTVIICMQDSSSLDNVNQTERSAVKIRSFRFDANYMQSNYVNTTSLTDNK